MYAVAFGALSALLAAQTAPVEQIDRYATAIAAVVETEPLPFTGRDAKERAAALLAALAWHESRLLESIENCTFRTDHGWQDHGKSVGLVQLFEGASWYGHTRDDLCGNAELQFRLGLRYLSGQVKRCRTLEGGLSGYNANQCFTTTYAARVANTYRRLAVKLGL